MPFFKCKMCGGSLEIAADTTVIECEYCGTQQTLPKLDDEKRANMYDRANHFRRSNDFDKAMAMYESILNEDSTDAEVYWSLVLCRYGIEYVEDPSSHKRIPTVNRAQFTSIFDDENYKSALEYADSYQRVIYEAEAKEINKIQRDILAISQNEDPFDIFICYKETDKNGRRTQDSVLAQELYYQLKQEGFKVFFSRITLEDKLGSAYEPYIFAALNSAKVMVVLGTKSEHFNAVWVKNEWSRYLALIKQGKGKMLIPAYRDMDPYDLPEEFSHLQAQDMSKLGFMQDLVRGIKKVLGKDKKQTAPVTERVIINNEGHNIAPLLRRAHIFLEDGDWESADEYAEKVLDLNPECAEAYFVKLLVECELNKPEDILTYNEPISDSLNYDKAIRFATPEYRKTLEGYNDTIVARLEAARNEKVYLLGAQSMSGKCYSEAIQYFQQIPEYKDSTKMIEECERLRENARLEAIYVRAINLLKFESFDESMKLFASISDYKNAKQMVDTCAQRKENARRDAIYSQALSRVSFNSINDAALKASIKELETIRGYRDVDEKITALNARLEKWYEEKKQAEVAARIRAEQIKKKVKKALKIGIPSLIAFVTLLILLFTLIIPLIRYNRANKLLNAGEYAAAMAIYQDIGGFFKAEQRIAVLSAIDEIDNKQFASGIKGILAAGVPVKLTYNMNGGDFSGGVYASTPENITEMSMLLFSAAPSDNVTAASSGTSIPETVEFTYNSYRDFKGIQTPGRNGYRFVKWELVTYNYQIDGVFEMELNAVWSNNDYSITYELNGGSASPENPAVYSIEEDTFTLNNPTKTGYTFIGWTGTGLNAPTMSVTVEEGSVGNRTYTANWQVNTYTITYDADGGSVSTESQTVTYDTTVTHPTPTKEGYTFAGWFNGEKQYTDGIWNDASDLTLTAEWIGNSYNITYEDTIELKDKIIVTLDPNYSGSTPTTVTLTDDQILSYPVPPTRTGYAFAGWYTDSDCTTIYEFSGTIIKDITLYAKWVAMESSYTSRLYVDIAKYNSSTQKVSYISVTPGSSSYIYYYFTCYQSGTYTFRYSWGSTTGDTAITVYNATNGSTIIASHPMTDVYGGNRSASFTANAGDVIYVRLYTYNYGGASWQGSFYVENASYPTSTAAARCKEIAGYEYYTGETASQTVTFGSSCELPVLTRTGYTFLGWYNGETKVESGAWNIASDVTLVPRWEPATNTISLDANGGTVSDSEIGVTYSQPYTLPIPTRTGYTFEGWYCGTTKYVDGTWNSESDLALTARWTVNEYSITFDDIAEVYTTVTITYDYNYSGSTSSTVTLTNGQRLNRPTNPTRSGYVFTGWYTDSSCTARYSFIGSITADMTLYAGWMSVSSYSSTAHSIGQLDASDYTSSSDYWSVSTYGTYSSSKIYRFLVADETGTHSIYFRNGSSSYYYCLEIKNLTAGTTIKSNATITSTYYSSQSFYCSAGDVIMISLYSYYTPSTSYYSTAYFYFGGFSSPESAAFASSSICGFEYKNGSNCIDNVDYGSNYTLPTPTRTGYTFLGWYNGETKVESGAWNITSDVTLVPRWQAIENTITLYANGGNETFEPVTVTYDEAVTLPTPTREGYLFLGWFSGETEYTSGVWNYTSDVLLKAQWGLPSSTGLTYQLNADGKSYTVTGITSDAPADIVIGWYNSLPVTIIGEKAFYNCDTITSVTIGYGVTTIGNRAFSGCSELTSVTISDSVTNIGDSAFDSCSDLASVTIGSGVTIIGNSAFSSCYNLTSVTIPNSVTSIGYLAFDWCSRLTNITVDEENEHFRSIDGNLYSKDGKTLIQYAVGKKDASFTIPDSVTSIGDSAFISCDNLTSMVIPDSVTTIGEYAFGCCDNLTSVTIGNGVTTICNGAFYRCGNLTSITIPDSVTSIGAYAFSKCYSLTSVTIGKRVTSIGMEAFASCAKLSWVIIPRSVTYIGADAFWGGSNTLTIYCEASSMPSGWDVSWRNVDLSSVVWGYSGK